MSQTFITPPGFAGSSVLSASTGLSVITQGNWTFSRAGYNNGETFGVSLGYPNLQDSGVLLLRAENWSISVIGNELSSYTDPDTDQTYSADQCRIQVTGYWSVIRQPNSNSYNSFGVTYTGITITDQGSREFQGFPLSFVSNPVTYVIQGSAVTGGARDTFSNHVFFCECSETSTSDNSNRLYQSNTVATPIWIYSYSKSWEIPS
jgi:hypothetical protein